ncbi:MAG: hypothetical protein AVDCRST_MAG25-1231 [uncultured Rubrobacteraceae bacterium]|uniref:Uncharacterized protein n=1 Tax=uncultured Rubrobacteraceae bacterium TaxID=349277 RepID=A0A6J4R4A5_9ACTN|nr:MAG: hypothetical protein AVDCRST_MAG25-1231 [uncultured Rubrobacteraceae bacterium]
MARREALRQDHRGGTSWGFSFFWSISRNDEASLRGASAVAAVR